MNKKQCEINGHLCRWSSIGDVQDSDGVFTSEMTYIVSGWVLNSTRSFNLSHGYAVRICFSCWSLFSILVVLVGRGGEKMNGS